MFYSSPRARSVYLKKKISKTFYKLLVIVYGTMEKKVCCTIIFTSLHKNLDKITENLTSQYTEFRCKYMLKKKQFCAQRKEFQ